VTVVFVFLGEFGYELLNWQGVVQKYRRLHPEVDVVCASRGQVAALYPGTTYVDVGEVPLFRESVASGYAGLRPGDEAPNSEGNRAFDEVLRAELRTAILARLRERRGWKLAVQRVRGLRWVFSSARTVLDGCVFGADSRLFGSVPGEGNIYDALDLRNNLYVPVEPDEAVPPDLEARAGLTLDQPYALVQTRRRAIRHRSTDHVDERAVVAALAARMPVLALDFSTGRASDSYSAFDGVPDARVLGVRGFDEQACLIRHARACVFLTEGDFGSHIYVPPLLGREVTAIAPRDVYALGTTPIDFWNRNVFRFTGGRIDALVAEEVKLDELADRLAG
jgi:hypothetical protein